MNSTESEPWTSSVRSNLSVNYAAIMPQLYPIPNFGLYGEIIIISSLILNPLDCITVPLDDCTSI